MNTVAWGGAAIQDLTVEEMDMVSGAEDWRAVATGALAVSAGLVLGMACPPAGAALATAGVHIIAAGLVT